MSWALNFLWNSFVIQISEFKNRFHPSSSSKTMKSSRSLSGRHSKDVFLPRMANTDWSCTGQGPPFIEDFCTNMKIHTRDKFVLIVMIIAPVIVKVKVWRHPIWLVILATIWFVFLLRSFSHIEKDKEAASSQLEANCHWSALPDLEMKNLFLLLYLPQANKSLDIMELPSS